MNDSATICRLLARAKYNTKKSTAQIAEEMGVGRSSVLGWENYTLPGEERLPQLSKVYNISVRNLKKAFKISREAREKEKSVRLKKRNTKLIPEVKITENVIKSFEKMVWRNRFGDNNGRFSGGVQ